MHIIFLSNLCNVSAQTSYTYNKKIIILDEINCTRYLCRVEKLLR